MVAGAWPVGVEREIAPGNYVQLAAEAEGWSLWRFETATGIYRVASKAAEGRRAPTPLGVAQALYGETPYVRVQIGERVLAFLHSRHMERTKSEMRVEGARFMERVPVPFDPLPYDGQRLQVALASMPGPRSFTKLVNEVGVIDMTGVSAIVAAARALA